MAKHNTRAAWGSLSYNAKTRTARIRYWAETPQGYRRCSKTYRDVTRKQAEEHRAALMLEHGNDAPCPTVKQAWNQWLLPEMRRKVDDGDMSARSLTLYEGSYRREIEPRWGDVPCDEVRPLAIQQWITDMTYSQATYATMLLRRILGYACTYELIASNPMRERYVMPSKSTVRKRDDGTWTLAQLGEVWQLVHGLWYEAAFILSAFAGCRVGESLGARSEDVRLVHVDSVPIAIVDIKRQSTPDGKLSERLKTSWSYRQVCVPGRAALVIESIARERNGWLAGNGVGNVAKQSQLRSAWDTLMPKLPNELRHPYKNLRNSWQTNTRWTLKLPPWLIEPMMGHVGEGITGQHYDKPTSQMFAEAIAQAYVACSYDAKWTWLD